MEKTQKIEKENVNHSVVIDNNKRAVVTGVIEVISSTDKAVVAKTDSVVFELLGANLRVSKLDLAEKVCHVEGEIYKLEYNRNSGKSFFKRLFK